MWVINYIGTYILNAYHLGLVFDVSYYFVFLKMVKFVSDDTDPLAVDLILHFVYVFKELYTIYFFKNHPISRDN